MSSLANLLGLQDVVQQALEQERLGAPRFLRCMANVSNPRLLQDALNKLTTLSEVWFGSYPTRRHIVGRVEAVYHSEILVWNTGQSALLAVSLASLDHSSELDLMLIGSRGTLYHEV